MPARPKWLLRVPDAIEQLDRLNRDIVTRLDVQTLLGVGKSRANTLMVEFGARRTGSMLTIARTVLLDVLKKRRAGRVFRIEADRQENLYSALRRARTGGVRFRVPIETTGTRLKNLPEGVTVGESRITVEYGGPKEALAKLYSLAQALANDYARFEALTDRRNKT